MAACLIHNLGAGPPYPYKEVLEHTFPHWKVGPTSTSTIERSPKAAYTFEQWDVEDENTAAGITSYVQQRCGNLLFMEALPKGELGEIFIVSKQLST